MSSYTYSLASDLSGSVSISQLYDEINAESGITGTLETITVYQDDVKINFESALSGGEETVLNSLIAAHTPEILAPPGNKGNYNVVTVSSDTNVTFNGGGILYHIDTSSGDVSMTLPFATDVVGESYIFHKTSSLNNMIVQTKGSDTIDGDTKTSITLSPNNVILKISSVSTNMWITG